MVHHDLVMAGIESGVVDEVCILVDRMDVFSGRQSLKAIRESVEELPPEIGRHISLSSAVDLTWRHLDMPNCVAIGKSSEWTELAALRRAFRAAVPVCGIVHSCIFPDVLAHYAHTLLSAEVGDVFCCSSGPALTSTRCLLDQAEGWLVEAGAKGVSRHSAPRLALTPLACRDTQLEPLDRAMARKLLGWPDDQVIYLCFGRLSTEYKADLASLLLVFRRLHSVSSSTHLVIAGSDIHSGGCTNLKGEIRACGLDGAVSVLANVDPVRKRALFSAADVFVAPSDNLVESFGLSIIEAMGAGLPVVASNWSGYRDLVIPGKTGFLVNTTIADHVWSDASLLGETGLTPHAEYFVARQTVLDVQDLYRCLLTLAQNPAKRLRLGAEGRKRAMAEYVWSKAIDRFGDVWRESIAMATAAKRRVRRLDLRQAFAHYQSRPINSDSTLFVTVSNFVDDQLLRSGWDPATRHLVDMCAEAPRLLPHLSATPSQRERLGWLLKRGILSLTTDPVLRRPKEAK